MYAVLILILYLEITRVIIFNIFIYLSEQHVTLDLCITLRWSHIYMYVCEDAWRYLRVPLCPHAVAVFARARISGTYILAHLRTPSAYACTEIPHSRLHNNNHVTITIMIIMMVITLGR